MNLIDVFIGETETLELDELLLDLLPVLILGCLILGLLKKCVNYHLIIDETESLALGGNHYKI